MKGVSTIIATILMLVITISLTAFAFSYMQGMFTRETAVILNVDPASACSGLTITVVIDNSGTSAVDASRVRISGVAANGMAITEVACATTGTISAGSVFECTNKLSGGAGYNKVRVKEPAGRTRESTVPCM